MPKSQAEKKIVSVIAAGGGEQFHGVEVTPGTTPRDLRQRLNISGNLRRFVDAAPFGDAEDIYSRVEDGDKLVVGPSTPVADQEAK